MSSGLQFRLGNWCRAERLGGVNPSVDIQGGNRLGEFAEFGGADGGEDGGLEADVKPGKPGGAEAIESGAEISLAAGALVVSGVLAVQREDQVEAGDRAKFVDAAAQERGVHFDEHGAFAIDDVAGDLADVRIVERGVAANPDYRRRIFAEQGQDLCITGPGCGGVGSVGGREIRKVDA